MNEIFIKFEEMPIDELEMVFEYLVETMNFKKEQKRLKKKYLKHRENLATNSQAEYLSAQNAET